jgi:membrane-associated progesterone receptor component
MLLLLFFCAVMSNPAGAPAGAHGHGGGDAASAAPVRVSEGTPNPDRVFTLSELKKYDGSNPTGPIYIGTAGKVFDVTSGAGFYGPGGPYGCFAGTDASRGLAKMDLKSASYGVDDLTGSEKGTLKEWADKYESKYPVVGKIIDPSQPNSGPAPEGGWPAKQ